MRDLLSIYQAIELIETRLRDDVSVSEMATAAGYSLYHFIRIFDQVVWHTPYDYLMRRRLSEAAHELVTGNRRVLDIAIDFQFNNHETFSRAFKRLFGLQPVQWRERGVIPRCALMPAISRAYLEHVHHPHFQPPQQVAAPQRCLAGLMTALTSQPDAGIRLWRDLEKAKPFCLPNPHKQHFFGVTSYPDEQGEQAFYLAARELDSGEAVEPFGVCQTLPAGDYICVSHQAPLDAIPFTLAYLYHTWLPKAGLKPAYPLEIIDFGAAPPWAETPIQVTLWLPVKKSGMVS
jgi:AraC family transcriptional regulator